MSDPPTLGVSNFLLENGCPSPKLHLTCIFNHFLRPLAACSDDATLRLLAKFATRRPAGKGFQAGLSFVYNLSNSRRKFLWLRTLRNWGTERVPKDLRAGWLRTMPTGSPHLGRVLTRRVAKRRMRATRGGIFLLILSLPRNGGTKAPPRTRKPTARTTMVGFSIQSLFNSLLNHFQRADLALAALEARP